MQWIKYPELTKVFIKYIISENSDIVVFSHHSVIAIIISESKSFDWLFDWFLKYLDLQFKVYLVSHSLRPFFITHFDYSHRGANT